MAAVPAYRCQSAILAKVSHFCDPRQTYVARFYFAVSKCLRMQYKRRVSEVRYLGESLAKYRLILSLADDISFQESEL